MQKKKKKSWNYPNLINGKSICNINQVVAGDLTYVFIGRSLFYVFSLQDLYSNRIVGMSVEWKNEGPKTHWRHIFNGNYWERCNRSKVVYTIQTERVTVLLNNLFKWVKRSEVQISRAKTCLENGYAEQWNGLLKNHFIPTIKYQNMKKLTEELKQITYFYNYERKQEQLGWQAPCWIWKLYRNTIRKTNTGKTAVWLWRPKKIRVLEVLSPKI